MQRITVTVASVQRLLNISFDLYCLGVALSGYILFDQLCCCRFKKNSIEIGENWDKKKSLLQRLKLIVIKKKYGENGEN